MIVGQRLGMRKIYIFILALSFSAANAQVKLDGANIYLSSGSVFHVNGKVEVDNGATVDNNGSFESEDLSIINGDFTNQAGGITTVTDTLFINDQFTNNDTTRGDRVVVGNAGILDNFGILTLDKGIRAQTAGATINSTTGTFAFVGPEANKELALDVYTDFTLRNLIFNSVNPNENIILATKVFVTDTLDFSRGLVDYVDENQDSLIVLNTGTVLADTNGNSAMVNSLYRYGVPNSLMRFPVGEAGRYRPFWILNTDIPGGNDPLIEVEYLGTTIVTPQQAVGYNPNAPGQNYMANSWAYRILDDSLNPSVVQVQFGALEGVLAESIVAEGFEIVNGDTVFFNLGQGDSATVTNGFVVQSEAPAQGNSVVMVGQSNELKFRARVFLEGALTGPAMTPGLTDTLAARFLFGGSRPRTMLPNKPLPASVIDSIKLYLRSTPTGPAVDSTSAWVMSDGTLRDFETGEGPFAVFPSAAPGQPYYVVIKHRNHLMVQTNTTVTLSNADPGPPATYDFTDIGNIYGGGGVRWIAPSTYALVAGNSNEDLEVNIFDYFDVGLSNANADQGYRSTNIVFPTGVDGRDVDGNDFSKIQSNSSVLYFSTVPPNL